MVVLLILGVAGLALIFVAMPGCMGSPCTPWDSVSSMVMAAMAGHAEALIVVGLAGSAAVATFVGSVWLSHQATDEQPG